MTAELDADDLAAWRAFLEAHAAVVAVLERELQAERGIPLSFYDVLVQLSEAGGRMRMSDLAGALLLSRSGATRLIDRIVAAGYAVREACPSDKRGTYAVLTPAGREALAHSWPTHAQGVQRHFVDALQPGEARTLAAVLQRVRAHALSQREGGRPPSRPPPGDAASGRVGPSGRVVFDGEGGRLGKPVTMSRASVPESS